MMVFEPPVNLSFPIHFVFFEQMVYEKIRFYYMKNSEVTALDAQLNEKIDIAADMIVKARDVVVFTGAGISTESGIPDFRSPGGIWTKFDPEDFTIDRFLSSPETRKKQWRVLLEGGLIADAEPNRAHLAVAELEKIGKLTCVITQNVDNLHQKAGNSPEKVFELHGNMRWLRCMGCDLRYFMEEMVEKYRSVEGIPACEECGGILKPDVVFFGELLPATTLKQATFLATRCDLCIVIGSSLVVYPAASIPVYARNSGAKLVIINNTPTSCDNMADLLIHHSAGEVMEKILEEVKRRL
jgi:NAD-dependent deacetylase